MKKLTLVFASFLLSLNLFGQDSVETPKVRNRISGIMGYFSIGGAQRDFSSINSSLYGEGFEILNELSPSFGGGGFLIRKNLVIGGEGQTFLTQRTENSHGWVSMEGGQGTFRLGYIFLNKSRFFLFPAVGIGGQSHVLTVQEKDSVSTFHSTIHTPRQLTRITAKSMILDFSLNFHVFVIGDGNNGGGISLALSPGYSMAPMDLKWKSGEAEISEAPTTTSFTGPYLRLNITGGGIMRNH